jgi:hypothetical protein
MQNTAVAVGATSVSVILRAFTVSTGAPKTDITHSTSGLELRYKRGATGAVTSFSAVTQTSTGAFNAGGIVHLHGGLYRVDVPNAAVDATAPVPPWVVISAAGVADCLFTASFVELMGSNPRAAAISTADIVAAEIAALDGFTATDTALSIDGVAHTITRNDTDGYVSSITAD